MGIAIVLFVVIGIIGYFIEKEKAEESKKNTLAAHKAEIQRVEREKKESEARRTAENAVTAETARKAVEAKAAELYEKGLSAPVIVTPQSSAPDSKEPKKRTAKPAIKRAEPRSPEEPRDTRDAGSKSWCCTPAMHSSNVEFATAAKYTAADVDKMLERIERYIQEPVDVYASDMHESGRKRTTRLKDINRANVCVRISGHHKKYFNVLFYPGTDRIHFGNTYSFETADDGRSLLNNVLPIKLLPVKLTDRWLALGSEDDVIDPSPLFLAGLDGPTRKEELYYRSTGWEGTTASLLIDPCYNRFCEMLDCYRVLNSHGTDSKEWSEYGPVMSVKEAANHENVGEDLRRRLLALDSIYESILHTAAELLRENLPDWKPVKLLYTSSVSTVFLAENQEEERSAIKLSKNASYAAMLKGIIPSRETLVPILDAREISFRSQTLALVRMPYYAHTLLPELARNGAYILTNPDASVSSVFCSSRGVSTVARQSEPFTSELLSLGADIAAALKQLHDFGYVHLDVKPDNFVCVEENGKLRWKLGDYGSAIPMSEQGSRIKNGTGRFMAPELLRHSNIRYSADVYSWGCAMISLVVGSEWAIADGYHFSFDSGVKIQGVCWWETSNEKEIALWKIVARAVHPDPNARFRDGGELFDALEELRKTWDSRDYLMENPTEKSKEPESQLTEDQIQLPEDMETVVKEIENAQSSSTNSGSTLEEIQRRVNEYEKAAIAANDAGKIKTAGLMLRLFHDEDAMKEISRSTMIGIFMLLKYDLIEARTVYDDLMKELNRTYTYVNLERLDR